VEIEILIIDDSSEDTALMLRALKKHALDHKVKILGDGQQAIDYLFNDINSREALSGLRAIFLDLKMPKISGIEVLKAIKENKSTKHLPVVVLTSSNAESDLKRCYELGCNSYVVKPVDFVQFIKTISDLGLYWQALNKTISSV
jgi:CheY-like chemotaxis protein